MANLYETMNVGTDGLVYDLNPATEAFFVTIKANAGALKRGTDYRQGDIFLHYSSHAALLSQGKYFTPTV